MGMFDELIIEYPLPDTEVQHEVFQTKSLEQGLLQFKISSHGKLILLERKWKREDDMPLPSKPGIWFGEQMFIVSPGDVEIPYHGDLFFHTRVDSNEDGSFEWYEYQARFIHGQLRWIKRVANR
jgi:hypothetical protein